MRKKSMARKFATLVESMPPARKIRIRKRTKSMLREIRLQELRQTRQISQEALASMLGSKQAAVSKFERRDDWYLSTLRTYVEALGGKLELRARFADEEFAILENGDSSTTTKPAKRTASKTARSKNARKR